MSDHDVRWPWSLLDNIRLEPQEPDRNVTRRYYGVEVSRHEWIEAAWRRERVNALGIQLRVLILTREWEYNMHIFMGR